MKKEKKKVSFFLVRIERFQSRNYFSETVLQQKEEKW